MGEERKYTIIGKVEIGTDEYRDLIENLAEAKADASRQSRNYWAEQTKVSNLEKEIEQLKSYKEFVAEKCLDSYKLWLVEKSED